MNKRERQEHRQMVADLGRATADVLRFVNAAAPFDERRPALRDCFVIRHWVEAHPSYPLKPARRVDHLIDIFEPLPTKAPGPHIASPWCCYSDTVIFYAAPYAKALPLHHWRDRSGVVHTSSRGFQEFDQIRMRLRWDDMVEYSGDRFVVGGCQIMGYPVFDVERP